MSYPQVRVSGVWTSTVPYVKASGLWYVAKEVWAKAGGVWRKVGAQLTSCSVPATVTTFCGYYGPPDSECDCSEYVSVVPVDGYDPLTYSWAVLSGDLVLFYGNQQTCLLVGQTGTFRCTVTDASGMAKVSNTGTWNCTQENLNL